MLNARCSHWIAAASLLFLSACEVNRDTSPVVAKIGELSITENDLKNEFGELAPSMQPIYLSATGPKLLLDRVMRDELLLSEAKARGIDKEPESIVKIRQAERQALISIMKERLQSGSESDIQNEISAYYRSHFADFAQKDVLTLSQIVTRTPADMQKAIRLLRTQPFASVARKMSIDKVTAENGGQLTPIFSGMMPPEIEKQVAGLKPGGISKPIKTSNGLVIYRLEQKAQRPARPLQAVAPAIKSILLNKAVSDWADRKLGETKPQIDEKALYAIRFWPLPQPSPAKNTAVSGSPSNLSSSH